MCRFRPFVWTEGRRGEEEERRRRGGERSTALTHRLHGFTHRSGVTSPELGRMISNQEDDEFIAVRVQDPRIQNEGSWNSYVDYKIFLHTNSKAFTAKTSCVRRRYSEFAWLKKKLQKNAGLVPVPDLPAKSFFSFSNEDFLEGRRKGLQTFLDKVVHMTVCLSDSQLHLFLQTQLPVGHIEDCVQGHTPYTVTDAILTYASSNRGFAQAQEDDSIKEPSLTVSYESMESPAPHQPCLQPKETFSPELVSCGDPDPLESILQLCDHGTVELQHQEKSSIRVLQMNNHLEAVVEDCGPGEASFFLGECRDDCESFSEQTQQRSCQIQTPVEVHSPMGTGFEVNCGAEEVSVTTLDQEEKAVDTQEEGDQQESSEEANIENKSVNSVAVLDLKDSDAVDVLQDVRIEKQVLENHVISEHVSDSDDHVEEKSEPVNEERAEPQSKEEAPEIQEVPQVERGGDDDAAEQTDQKQQEADLVGTKDESDEDSRSLTSSNESIVKVSDEESACDETRSANGFVKTSPKDDALWTDTNASRRNILDLHMNGCISTQEEEEEEAALQSEDLQYITETKDLSKSLELNSTVTGGDLTENSDFSIIETSCSPVIVDSNCTEQELSEETPEEEVR
ncbi:Sorting nexin-11 [Collichthys lucidus]|uniref:Sorting nexin-11 n=1 Tax=Collichthys lucidus TaxID=240159 RepID=A0A4U5VQJ4_COLLU|nr:Sorting nexin-11 [Collichthys lucidus]